MAVVRQRSRSRVTTLAPWSTSSRGVARLAGCRGWPLRSGLAMACASAKVDKALRLAFGRQSLVADVPSEIESMPGVAEVPTATTQPGWRR